MWKRLQGWKEKLLSQAGKEILIKSVIQAIPTYTMSCFKLLKGLIKELEMLIQTFWWGYSGDSRKVHWVKWKKLCKAKDRGGMGFKDIEKFNDALGFEPTTSQLTADRSTTELLRNNGRFDLIEFNSRSQPMTNMSSKFPS